MLEERSDTVTGREGLLVYDEGKRALMLSTLAAMASEPVGLSRIETYAAPLDHPEGVAVADDGTVYTGGEAGQIYAINPDRTVREVANTGGFVLGLALDGDGLLYACDDVRHAVFRIDPRHGIVDVLSGGLDGRPMRSPNWPAFDERGNLYVSDSGDWGQANGLIWMVRPDGRVEVFSEQAMDFPNGLAIAADGSRMYVVESTPGRIVEIPFADDGTAGARHVLLELGFIVPDGIAVASDGSLIVACYRPDAIFRWSRGDGLDVLAADPQGTILAGPSNIAFAGRELQQVFIANVAGWHVGHGELGISGAPLHRPSVGQSGPEV